MIGRVVKLVEDKNRKEIYAADDRLRSFPVSIYYPTEESGTKNLVQLYEPMEKEVLHVFSLLEVDRTKLEQITMPVKDNAVPIKNTYPVVLLSPAFGLDRDLYVELITELVKMDFIVITISAPYDSIYTIFPSREMVYQPSSFPPLEDQLEMRVKDIQCVLDELENWNKDSFFNGMFNVNKIGGLGHSMGGAAMYNLSTKDSRLQCAVLLDASLHLLNLEISSVPILNLRQQFTTFEEYNEAIKGEEDSVNIAKKYIETLKKLYDELPNKDIIKVNGAEHLSFSTFYNLINEVPDEVMATIQSLVSLYLQQHLQEKQDSFDPYVAKEKHCNRIDGSGVIIQAN